MYTLIMIIVAIVVLIRFISAAAKQGQEMSARYREEEGRTYEVDPDELKKIMQVLGRTTGQGPPAGPPTGAQPQQSVARGPQTRGAVTPTAPRPRGGQIPAQPSVARPRPAQPRAAGPARPPEPTQRLIQDEVALTPTIGEHLKERRLSEGEAPLVPTVEGHIQQRHLGEDQMSLVPAIEEHLRQTHLAETEAMMSVEGLAGGPTGLAPRTAARGAAIPAHRAVRGETRKSFRVPALDRHGLRQALVLSEILSPPLALRPPRD